MCNLSYIIIIYLYFIRSVFIHQCEKVHAEYDLKLILSPYLFVMKTWMKKKIACNLLIVIYSVCMGATVYYYCTHVYTTYTAMYYFCTRVYYLHDEGTRVLWTPHLRKLYPPRCILLYYYLNCPQVLTLHQILLK